MLTDVGAGGAGPSGSSRGPGSPYPRARQRRAAASGPVRARRRAGAARGSQPGAKLARLAVFFFCETLEIFSGLVLGVSADAGENEPAELAGARLPARVCAAGKLGPVWLRALVN